MSGETGYLVTWKIDTEAAGFLPAAREALDIQRDPNSEALVFEVTDLATGVTVLVDLDDVVQEVG